MQVTAFLDRFLWVQLSNASLTIRHKAKALLKKGSFAFFHFMRKIRVERSNR